MFQDSRPPSVLSVPMRAASPARWFRRTRLRQATSPRQPGAPPAARRVLVVEDNPDGLETLLALLDMLGHEVAARPRAAKPIERAASFQPDLVLLDLGLPVMDGFDVARALRQDPRLDGVFIAALTGWGADGDRQRTAEAGFDAHLTKPVELPALEKVLARSPCGPVARTRPTPAVLLEALRRAART